MLFLDPLNLIQLTQKNYYLTYFSDEKDNLILQYIPDLFPSTPKRKSGKGLVVQRSSAIDCKEAFIQHVTVSLILIKY